MNPLPTVDPVMITGDVPRGSTLTPAEYARLTGLHVRTVREKIRRGELAAQLVKGRHGPEYRIPHPDSHAGSPVIESVDTLSITGDTHLEPTEDPPWASEPLGRLVDLLEEKDRAIERLTRDNVEMAGRLGFVMGQLEEARARIMLLEAPQPATETAAASEMIPSPSEAQNGRESAVQRESGARPWWAFWRRVQMTS